MEPRPLKELLAEMAVVLEVPLAALTEREWALPPPRGLECLCRNRRLDDHELKSIGIPGPAYEIFWTKFEVSLIVYVRTSTDARVRGRYVCTTSPIGQRTCWSNGQARKSAPSLDDTEDYEEQ